MNEKIEPALTHEEWAHMTDPYVSPAGIKHTTERRVLPLEEAIEVTFSYDGRDFGRGCHGLAALALHGQPFGFTWEDVDALETALGDMATVENDRCIGPVEHDQSQRDQAAVASIRDRIAALLPPRETSG